MGWYSLLHIIVHLFFLKKNNILVFSRILLVENYSNCVNVTTLVKLLLKNSLVSAFQEVKGRRILHQSTTSKNYF